MSETDVVNDIGVSESFGEEIWAAPHVIPVRIMAELLRRLRARIDSDSSRPYALKKHFASKNRILTSASPRTVRAE
jgi:hypothetical protein